MRPRKKRRCFSLKRVVLRTMNAVRTTTMWVGLLTFIFVSCVSAPAFSPDEFQRVPSALQSSTRSLGLQTQLPADNEKITAENGFWDRIFSRRDNAVSGLAEVLFYSSLIAIGIVVLMTWRDNLWSSSRARRLESGAQGSAHAEATARMEKTQTAADKLASCGNFAEAMHILLLRSVDELRRHLGVSIAASLTSREILHQFSLSSEGCSAFADIIDRVESSYFGTHQPGAGEYMACRSSFDALTGVLRQYSAQNAITIVHP